MKRKERKTRYKERKQNNFKTQFVQQAVAILFLQKNQFIFTKSF